MRTGRIGTPAGDKIARDNLWRFERVARNLLSCDVCGWPCTGRHCELCQYLASMILDHDRLLEAQREWEDRQRLLAREKQRILGLGNGLDSGADRDPSD